ncbi:MAG: NADAR family protein [Candidatus Magasanikbacteria bacterium]
MKNRDPKLETSGDPIGFYEREFYVFSNFSSFAIEWRGRVWQTSEHAYQASKFFDVDEKIVEKIHQARSAHKAYKLAKEKYTEKVPEDFRERKIKIMKDICRNKLQQHDYVQRKLMQTGNKRLVEDSPKDDFWGWGPNRDGRNELGKIWMKLREEWRKSN